MDIESLLKSAEGKTLEFKSNLSSTDPIVRTLIAFANTSGGTLVVGVEDKTKTICGVKNPLKEEERLANLISELISPKLIPNIEVISWRNMTLIAVQVYPSNNRPHYLKKKGIEKGVYIRIGSTNRMADSTIIADLKRVVRTETFDGQPIPELNSEAIDFRVTSELFSHFRTLKEKDLKTLKILTEHQGKWVPSIGGYLLFGKDRLSQFPDAWMQVGRFQGQNKNKIIDSQKIDSFLPIAIEDALKFVEKHASLRFKITKLQRKEKWNIPMIALREAIINAVVHTDYSQHGAPIRLSIFDDRVEIENPGLIPFGMTIEDMYRGVSKLRNPIIGRIFNELRLIEQWGSGIRRMISACEENGLKPPLLEEIGTHFRVTIFLEKIKSTTVDPIDQIILEALKNSEGLSTKEISEKINRSTRSTRTRLINLVDRGLVVELGLNSRDPNRKYFLSEN